MLNINIFCAFQQTLINTKVTKRVHKIVPKDNINLHVQILNIVNIYDPESKNIYT